MPSNEAIFTVQGHSSRGSHSCDDSNSSKDWNTPEEFHPMEHQSETPIPSAPLINHSKLLRSHTAMNEMTFIRFSKLLPKQSRPALVECTRAIHSNRVDFRAANFQNEINNRLSIQWFHWMGRVVPEQWHKPCSKWCLKAIQLNEEKKWSGIQSMSNVAIHWMFTLARCSRCNTTTAPASRANNEVKLMGIINMLITLVATPSQHHNSLPSTRWRRCAVWAVYDFITMIIIQINERHGAASSAIPTQSDGQRVMDRAQSECDVRSEW